MPDQVFLKYQSNNEALAVLIDDELKDLLKNASRGTVRCMGDMSMRQIESGLLSLGIDPAEVKGLGDKRKKSTLLKVAIASLSTIDKDMDKAIDELSFYLGLQDPQYLDEDEKERLEQAKEAATVEVLPPQPEQVQPAKVTKAELQAKKQKQLNSQPASVRWECDFAGEVSIGKEVREFWVADPYTEAVVNLVTSNGTVILSAWGSTKENPFMRAVVREFHELLATRGNTDLIENRLMTISLQLQGSKKREGWHVQSHETLVLIDGKKMEFKRGGQYLMPLNPFDTVDLNEGKAYKTAQKLARDFSDRYSYVEGFVLIDHKLIHHAWLQDRIDNKVVEVVFKDCDLDTQYLGIALNIGWVEEVIASRLPDDSISPRFSQSIIEGDFLDDFKSLKSGLISKATVL
jgi:hypothetical protein